MDLSGVIFVVLAVAWAVYLIPKALKHHDEVARTRSIDRFSTAMRVLARREPVGRRDARLVVTPARPVGTARVQLPSEHVPATTQPPVQPAAPVSPARRSAQRRAAQVAARRRRRVLGLLLVVTLTTVVAAALSLLPWYVVAAPVVVTALWLVVCRTQVRRTAAEDWVVAAAAEDTAADVVVVRRPAARVEALDGALREPAARHDEQRVADFDDTEDTVSIEVPVFEAVMVPTEDGGSLWDPLPVTLPTYVTKPKAQRTVRTIELGEPGTWTSGRTVEDAEIVAQAQADEAAAEAEADGTRRRAVGS